MRFGTLSKWALPALISVLLVVLSATVTAYEPEGADPRSVVSQFAGSTPERCVFAGEGLQLCSWSLEGRLIGSTTPDALVLALNLICELGIAAPFEGEPRCEVHPTGQLSPALPPVGAGDPEHAPARILDSIALAATTTEISWAMGVIPTQCRSGSGAQRCDWPVAAGGGAALDATLRCELPLDGTPRRADSCQIVERADPEPS